MSEYTYFDWKDDAHDSYTLYTDDSFTPEECRNMMESQENEYGDGIKGNDVLFFALAVAEIETRLDVLEDKVLDTAAYYIYRFENMGCYREGVSPEEIAEIEKDIAYIRSKVDLPELESYDLEDAEE